MGEREENPGGDLVGMLDHVFKKTFKQYYGSRSDENAAKQSEDNQKSSEPKISCPGPSENEDLKLEAEDGDTTKEMEEAGDNKNAEEEKSCKSEQQSCGDGVDVQNDDEIEQEVKENEDRSKVEGEGSQSGSKTQVNVVGPETEVEADEAEAFSLAYEKQVAQVSQKLENEIKVASELDQYLLETKQLAAKADERIAEELYSQGLLLKTEYPVDRSQLNIDKEKLERFEGFSQDLVLPKDLMKANEQRALYVAGRAEAKDKDCSFSQQLRPSTPNYLKGVIKKDEQDNSKSGAKKEDEALRVIEPEAMSMENQHANQTQLDRMNNKLNFLKNPRFAAASKNLDTKAGRQQRCRVIPEVVRFEDYRAAELQETELRIQNLLGISQFLRIIPPASKHFAIGTPVYPSEAGMLAPGMSCSVPVLFMADSMGDYSDVLHIQTEVGEIEVRLVAEREKPVLSLPETLLVGPCLKGERPSMVLQCKNTGGAATFAFVTCDSEEGSLDEEKLPPFSIQPTTFALEKGETVDVTVTMDAAKVGNLQRKLDLVSNLCTRQTYTLQGHCHELEVKVTALNGHDYTPANCRIPKTICFDDVTVGAVRGKEEWNVIQNSEICQELEVNNSVLSPFSVEPCEGTFNAKSSQEFRVRFSPATLDTFDGQINLFAKDVPVPGGKSNDKTNVDILEFQLHGESVSARLEISPPMVAFNKRLTLYTSYVIKCLAHNPSDIELDFAIESAEPELVEKQPDSRSRELSETVCPPQAISVEVMGGPTLRVGPGETVEVTVNLQFFIAGELELCLSLFDTRYGPESSLAVVRVHASVDGPCVEFQEPQIDFGLFAVNAEREEKLELFNPGMVPANVRLTTCQQHVNDTEDDPETDIAEIEFDVNEVSIAPGDTASVVCKCKAGSAVERLRRLVVCELEKGSKSYLSVCGEIQTPIVYLTSKELADGIFQLGTTYVSVAVQKKLYLVNLSNLPAPFQFAHVNSAATSNKFELEFSEMQGTVAPKSTQEIVVSFKPVVAGRLCAVYECKVKGMKKIIGFGLETVSKGLEVETTVLTEDGGSTSGVIDFGPDIPLYQRRKIQIQLSNQSAIPTRYRLSFKRFGGVDPPQSLIDEKPTGFLLKPSYSALKAYSSKSGRSYMAEKLSMEEDRKCLQDGEWIDLLRNLYFLFQKQGVALVALPDEGALGAWSSKTIDVYCLNNMPGIYKSAMVCDIDGLDAKQIPIKLGIKGSPLKVANTTLGLSSTQDSKGECRLSLNLGCVLVGGEFQDRRVKVANNGPFAAVVSWSVLKEKQESVDPVVVHISAGDAEDKLPVSVVIDANPELSTPPPFQVIPEELKVEGHSSGEFIFRYLPNESHVSTDCAMARADATFEPAPTLGLLESASLQSTTRHKTQSLCGSASQPSCTSSNISLRSSAKSIAMSSTLSDSASSFAKFDRLRGWAKIELVGESFLPKLHCDRPILADGFVHVDFFVSVDRASKTPQGNTEQLTLQNKNSKRLVVGLSTSKAFRIVLVESPERSLRAGKDGKLDAVVVEPGGVLTLDIQFVGSLKPKGDTGELQDDVNNELTSWLKGDLLIKFDSGRTQTVKLEAMIERAAIEVYPANLDFGLTHVERMRHLPLKLRTFTNVALKWKVECIQSKSPGDDSSLCFGAPDAVWTFEPSEGVIDRSKIPVRIDNSLTPIALAKEILPDNVTVYFRPRVRGRYFARFRFVVQNGVDFEITLQGEGSYEENHDDSTKRLPAPL